MIKLQTELAFHNWAKPFHLYFDASDVQLGTTLDQDGKPLGFYTRKLKAAQTNYTVGEKELLGLVEGIKAFKGIVRGYKIIIHTGHLNLLYQKLPNQRMIRQRLLLEDFHPQVKHIAGQKNLLADALSQLEMKHKSHDIIDWEPPQERLQYSDNNPNHKMVMWLNSIDYKPRLQQQMTLSIYRGNSKNRRILASQSSTHAMGSTKQQKVSQGSGNINAMMSFPIY